MPEQNGCRQTMRSLSNCESLSDYELTMRLLQPRSWFPSELHDWMQRLPTWYEDAHAIYVHAGLDENEGGGSWKHPRDSRPRPLMWTRDPGFYKGYKGKRVIVSGSTVLPIPEEVYAENDINEFLDSLNDAVDGFGVLQAFWEGPEWTAVYVYGPSAQALIDIITPLVDDHPLAQGHRLDRIA